MDSWALAILTGRVMSECQVSKATLPDLSKCPSVCVSTAAPWSIHIPLLPANPTSCPKAHLHASIQVDVLAVSAHTMEGQAQDIDPAAQPHKFQRYRSVRKAPKQGVASSAPAAMDPMPVKSISIRVKDAQEASSTTEAALPARQRHSRAEQGTAVKSHFANSETTRAKPQDVIHSPASHPRQARAELEAVNKPISASEKHQTVERMASTRVSSNQHHQRPREAQRAPQEDKMADIAQPGFDAPISAVNAGDRHVYVACNKSQIAFPVTPSTTALELIEAAAAAMPLEKLDATSAMLWEEYQLYLFERPLRRYETVRDVLNSWDGDQHNKLFIVSAPGCEKIENLDIRYAPGQQPSDSTYFMYHTHKNGKWGKRIVTLHADGQVTVNKEGAKEKERQNICHLSDFDIYSMKYKYQKIINAPRFFCFAIKSQQKQAVFHLNEDNFVHFFSTKDERLAKSFYQAVHRWRSWHLVHVMGKTQRSPKQETSHASSKPIPVQKHQKSASADATTNGGLGSYKPLISPSRFERSDHKKVNAAKLTSRSPPQWEDYYGEHYRLDTLKPVSRSKTKPPVSFPKKLTKDPETGAATTNRRRPSITQESLSVPESEPFAATGLLGNKYQEHIQGQHQQLPANPPTVSPAEVRYHPPPHQKASPTRPASIRGAKPAGHHASPTRKSSPPRDLVKPLVDLTPKFFEPPQHIKRERRIIPERLPSSNLVDIATTPEVAISVPSATAWRRPGTSSGEGAASGQVSGHDHERPDGHANGHAKVHGSSNTHLRHQQNISREHRQQAHLHPLQQSPGKPPSSNPPLSKPRSDKAAAIPRNANSDQPLARRGTLKTVGGPLNKSSRKSGSGNQAYPDTNGNRNGETSSARRKPREEEDRNLGALHAVNFEAW